MFDRESLFQMLANKDWDSLAKVLYKNSDLIHSDPIIHLAIQLFENEFFRSVKPLSPKEKLSKFEYIGLVLDLKQKSFTESFATRFIDEKLEALQFLKSDQLLSFAAAHQNRPLAQKIIKEIQSAQPEVIADARRENVTIKATKTNANYSKIINLFKSKQEENFFEAIRKAFPTFHPYPNVAMSSVLDFNLIRSSLTRDQEEYFFRAIIDSVVFDPSEHYKPVYFFELDSHFHDNDRARKNDEMKNKIFEAANVKLIRIRAHDLKETSVTKLNELVSEVMREL